MRKIPAIISISLAAATLFSCSYDSSEIENGITDLENRVAALEQKADYLESQLKRFRNSCPATSSPVWELTRKETSS